MKREVARHVLGDMTACYETDESGKVGLLLCPTALAEKQRADKSAAVDSLVQVKLAGDEYNGAFAPGQTMREGGSVKQLRFREQKVLEDKETNSLRIETRLADERGCEALHRLLWNQGAPYVRMETVFENHSDAPVSLEMLASFSLQGISPWIEGDCHNQIMVHRIRGRWSEEGRLESQTMEELQLETSWTREAVRCERFGSIGSMPVNKYFPFLALEDRENHVFWGAQLESPSSWQMEIYRMDDNIAVDGGLADREFGHWMKRIAPGEAFASPQAIVTVCQTEELDVMAKRLTDAGEEILASLPESEKELPIIFNEYCTTWGDPSHENILQILDAIKDKGFSYFVIDCGWYKQEGDVWELSMGDYQVSPFLFPDGLEKTVEAIKGAGLKPGIWFEIENAGPASKAYRKNEHFLKRDGVSITTHRRRFWDMRDPWVQDYLDRTVIGTLKKYGFDYIKVDYNDDFGIGADGSESQGETLRQNMQATYGFFEKMTKEIPGLIVENCASGGHRLEPGFMKRCSMASFSDAHECVEIPIIAANLHRVILPRQSQIWAVIRETDSLKRMAYSVINTFLGRMCISGDVLHLTPEQWAVLEGGMAFYRKIAPVIAKGQSYHFGSEVKSMRHPEGWQILLRVGEEEAYLTIHTFDGKLPEEIVIDLPQGLPARAEEIFSDTAEEVTIENGKLRYAPKENWKAVAVRLTR